MAPELAGKNVSLFLMGNAAALDHAPKRNTSGLVAPKVKRKSCFNKKTKGHGNTWVCYCEGIHGSKIRVKNYVQSQTAGGSLNEKNFT